MRGKKGGRGKPNEGQREETGTTERDEREERQRERERERAEGKNPVGRVEQADEFINFKSWLQCRLVGGAFMALRPGPPATPPSPLPSRPTPAP